MTTDMMLTLNALPAKDSGKDVRRATESQPAALPQGAEAVTEKSPVEKSTRTEGSDTQSSAVPKEQLVGAVSQMQDFAQMLNRELQFDVDEDLGRTVVRVLDKESGDLIRQIPSDEVLALAKQMKEMRESELEGVDGTSALAHPVGFLMKTQA
ncbi:MAG: flagellar protein FlaG [Gammaproteobacteria bacterium]|nr:flagellar protein FlaG [Gammaproteobacteria bacterium]